MATEDHPDLALLRLLQLVSPALPVGAYAYSQGLEQAVQLAWITNEAQAAEWIEGVLENGLARVDAPVLLRLHAAWSALDLDQVEYWNHFLYACRESAELQAEDRTLARALTRLLIDLGVSEAKPFATQARSTFASLFALAAVHWKIPAAQCVQGYLWSWAENQVAAAIKLVPLGQTAGQRISLRLGERIPHLAEAARALADEDIGQTMQGLAMASAWHETQYSRLFRS
ncbi:MAG: urease accessory protein UreF [Gammaproteobacteria bacterium]|nr:urease accessory protein UreF [Gammaproteobacteria bacterium]